MANKTFIGVTLHGLPVQIELQWPFHRSEGGSDWYVVHGTVRVNDGGPLHADVALNLAQTVREALPSLDSDLAFWVAVNTARKALDDKQLELLKSGKRQPVPVSSRCYSIRHQHFRFAHVDAGAGERVRRAKGLLGKRRRATAGADRRSLRRAVSRRGRPQHRSDKLLRAAKDLAARGMVEFAGDYARATDSLFAQREAFVAAKDHALEELHLKHAFERA